MSVHLHDMRWNYPSKIRMVSQAIYKDIQIITYSCIIMGYYQKKKRFKIISLNYLVVPLDDLAQ